MAASPWRGRHWLPLVLHVAAAALLPSKHRHALRPGPQDGNLVKDETYYVHIPKAGGISFTEDAEPILQEAGLFQNSREGCYSWAASHPKVKDVMVMFRHPSRHVLSQFNFCLTQWIHQYVVDLEAVTDSQYHLRDFPTWVRTWTDLKAANWHGNFTPQAQRLSKGMAELHRRTVRVKAWSKPPYSARKTTLKEAEWPQLCGGGTIWQHAHVPFMCYSPINVQTQRMSCSHPMVYPEKMDLDLAMRNMREASFVGILEAYQSSMCLLHAKFLGGRMPDYCNCENPAQWAKYDEVREVRNPTDTHLGLSKISSFHQPSIPPELSRAVEDLTDLDRKLYQAAWKRFVEDARLVHSTTGVRILCNETSPLRD